MKRTTRKTLSSPTQNINEVMTIATLRHYATVFSQSANFLEATVKVNSGIASNVVPTARTGTKRVLSIAARRKIALAQKKRWANKTHPNVATIGKGKSTAAAA